MTIKSTNQSRYRKAKGRNFENSVVDYLRLHGFNAERRRLGGSVDYGDISGVDKWCLEVKAYTNWHGNLSKFLRETELELKNAADKYGAEYAALIVKRRGKPHAKDGLAILPMSMLVKIMEDLR